MKLDKMMTGYTWLSTERYIAERGQFAVLEGRVFTDRASAEAFYRHRSGLSGFVVKVDIDCSTAASGYTGDEK